MIRDLPVANSCPTGQLNVTMVPKPVSRLDAMAPSPGFKLGQSAENIASQPLSLWSASVWKRTNISPLEAVKVILGMALFEKPLPGCNLNPLVLAPS